MAMKKGTNRITYQTVRLSLLGIWCGHGALPYVKPTHKVLAGTTLFKPRPLTRTAASRIFGSMEQFVSFAASASPACVCACVCTPPCGPALFTDKADDLTEHRIQDPRGTAVAGFLLP